MRIICACGKNRVRRIGLTTAEFFSSQGKFYVASRMVFAWERVGFLLRQSIKQRLPHTSVASSMIVRYDRVSRTLVNSLIAEKDKTAAEKDKTAAEKDKTAAALSMLLAEKDKLAAALSEATAEKEKMRYSLN